MAERPMLFSAASQAHGDDGFWSRADRTGGPDACWPWLGARNPKGYGRRNHRGRMTLAHRVALLISGVPIPTGFTVDHLCRNRACVNPGHLEAVPHRVNLLRGHTITALAASATHCPQGHPYPEASAEGRKRNCLTCGRARSSRNYVRTTTRHSRPWLDDAEKRRIRDLVERGLPHSEIAALTGLSLSTISRVRNS